MKNRIYIVYICEDILKLRIFLKDYIINRQYHYNRIYDNHRLGIMFNIDKINSIPSYIINDLLTAGIDFFINKGPQPFREFNIPKDQFKSIMVLSNVTIEGDFLNSLSDINTKNPCITYITKDNRKRITLYDTAALDKLNLDISKPLENNPANPIEGTLELIDLGNVIPSSKPKIPESTDEVPKSVIYETYPINEYTARKLSTLDPIKETNEWKLYTSLIFNDIDSFNKEIEENISIATPVHNIGNKIFETYYSLASQSFSKWEWILVNNSTDGGETLDAITYLSDIDSRVRVFNLDEFDEGNIGNIKNITCSLARGGIIVELDHDDLLLPECLELIKKASERYPEAGFFYSNGIEVDSKYNSMERYPEGFSMGFGSYKEIEYYGLPFDMVVTSPINPKTIRHIVGVPNHVRAWRTGVYSMIGGHNYKMRIADDYELIIRTFLATRLCFIQKPLYIQRFGASNSQDIYGNRNDIQTRVACIANYYNEAIAKRFASLGVDDYVYNLTQSGKFPNAVEVPALHEDIYNVNLEY